MGIFIDSPTPPPKKKRLSHIQIHAVGTLAVQYLPPSTTTPSSPLFFPSFFMVISKSDPQTSGTASAGSWSKMQIHEPHSNLLNYNLWGKGPENCLSVPARRVFTLGVRNHQSNRVECHYSLVPVGCRQLNLPGLISPF